MSIALVNIANGTTGTSATPATSLTAGNALIVIVSAEGLTENDWLLTVTDTAGNTYTIDHTVVLEQNGPDVRMAYVANCLGHASNVVTVTLDASASFQLVTAIQYSGLATSSLTDGTAANHGDSASATSGTVVTTNADDLLLSAIRCYNAVSYSAWLSSFTEQVDNDTTGAADRIVSATGSYSTGATISSSQQWTQRVWAFKATSAAPVISSTSPSDGDTGVSRTANVSITYDQNVAAGSGSFEIWNTTRGVLFESIPVGDGRVSISSATVTLNPDGTFEYGAEYALKYPAGIVIASDDAAPVAAISDFATLNWRVVEAAASTGGGLVAGSGWIGASYVGANEAGGALTPGVSAETDAALARPLLGAGAALETDVALTPTALVKTLTPGVSAETDAALARPLLGVGVALETDAALAPAALVKTPTPGVSAETDVALARPLLGVGVALETDAALTPAALVKTLAPGVAAETDAALALEFAFAGLNAGVSLETDAALAPAAPVKTLTPGVAAETDVALAPSALVKTLAPGVAAETDAALAPSAPIKTFTPGVALETDIAFALNLPLAAGTSLETDVALTPAALVKTLTPGAATETDAALAPSALAKTLTPGVATETDVALAPSAPVKTLASGVALETDAAQPLAWSRYVAAGVSAETAVTFALAFTRAFTSGVALETDAALARPLLGVGVALETDAALALVLVPVAQEIEGIHVHVVPLAVPLQAFVVPASEPLSVRVMPLNAPIDLEVIQ